ncbi:MAG: hydrogenase nickel incorporation protein HypB [Methylomonas sp.]|nr:hydrogenase nickel incorporation protein HypB [Methylomonas sp.]PPD22604.1 MAG: hydrogenase accessory protein HypB [Methylomonas sp.]PPD27914.1 MAG: hydrogenase accessory protein HypB [Methylomonas sp.]PPD40024.1 MAG: hydrogenase accessory protein HypB [Methylomonas sp.]PPD41588.1 MAG: hydrogenase accessory protein HypB [Methylomonas sp.]
MCGICGCDSGESETKGHVHDHHDHHDHHPHDHIHHHDDTSPERLVKIEQDILGKNNRYAEQNRRYFQQHGILALNLVSSPGAGKTTLLVATIRALKDRMAIAVIEGDQQTRHDADRIEAEGVAAVQINTGRACHLDAHGVGHAVWDLQMPDNSLLAIENVGNLVCPASFDLGEAHKVVVLSVTEGDDKPLKYPDIFRAADVMIVNKIDLLPYVDFDVERCIDFARRVQPSIAIIKLSATSGDGFSGWINWLLERAGRQQTQNTQEAMP